MEYSCDDEDILDQLLNNFEDLQDLIYSKKYYGDCQKHCCSGSGDSGDIILNLKMDCGDCKCAGAGGGGVPTNPNCPDGEVQTDYDKNSCECDDPLKTLTCPDGSPGDGTSVFVRPCPWGETPKGNPGLCDDCYKPGKGNRKCLCYDPAQTSLELQFVMPTCVIT